MIDFKPVRRAIPAALSLALIAGLAGTALAKKDKLPDALSGAKAGDVSAKPKSSGSDEKSLLFVKQAIGASDDEWPVLRPRVERVLGLLREANAGRDLRPPKTKEPKAKDAKPGDPPAEAAPKAASGVGDRSRDVLQAVADQQAPVGDVRARVAALRQARTRARVDLAKAQEELRELLTVRQEAVLIVVGVLE